MNVAINCEDNMKKCSNAVNRVSTTQCATCKFYKLLHEEKERVNFFLPRHNVQGSVCLKLGFKEHERLEQHGNGHMIVL